VFLPGDTDAALTALSGLRLSYTDRATFARRFGREKIMLEMARDILELAKGGHASC
jgi:hypothetical protein